MSGEMLAWLCLSQGANLHMAQLMSSPLTIFCSSKSRLVLPFLILPFYCWLTWVVPDEIQEGHKTVVCVCACVCVNMNIKHTHFAKLTVIFTCMYNSD